MILYIDSFALKYATTYELFVEIKNDSPGGKTKTETLAFTTQDEPLAGTMQVAPAEGIMLDTKFTVNLEGFSSPNPPLSYSLWGVT